MSDGSVRHIQNLVMRRLFLSGAHAINTPPSCVCRGPPPFPNGKSTPSNQTRWPYDTDQHLPAACSRHIRRNRHRGPLILARLQHSHKKIAVNAAPTRVQNPFAARQAAHRLPALPVGDVPLAKNINVRLVAARAICQESTPGESPLSRPSIARFSASIVLTSPLINLTFESSKGFANMPCPPGDLQAVINRVPTPLRLRLLRQHVREMETR